MRVSATEFQARAAAGAAGGDDVVVVKQCAGDVVKADGEDRAARFVFSTSDVDRDNDTIDQSGWDLTAFRANPVILWAHDHRGLPVGRATEVGVRGGRLAGVVKFAEHAFAQTVWDLVRGGFLRAVSVGFRALEWTRDDARGGVNFKRQELLEVSICPVPANQNALLAASASGIDMKLVRDWARSVLRDADDTLDIDVADDAIDADADLARFGREALARQRLNGAQLAGLIEPTVDVDTRELRSLVREAVAEQMRAAIDASTRRAVRAARGRLD
jgi:HK97 family phage prohead protease